MTVHYTSDLHIGHARVAAIRGYADTDAHDDALADSWRATVRKDDVVYVLGDIAVSGWPYALAFLAALPGRKHLVAGNHDPVHPMHRRTFTRSMGRFLEVFETVSPFVRRRVAGHEVFLSHFPYLEWGDGPDRPARPQYDQYRLPDLGKPLLHGHTHGTEREHGHSLHVGLDAWDGQLVPEARVVEWLGSLGGTA
ncbi:serine/threonine protein phosphatase [Microbacterium testaceum]|uniref:Serine/threonine protein phosphatase n=1 Tax=Microbacterium testaceum TaxID=2033 RepID=A0A4Y3QR85_MICTE|nr:metallophosphoesterase [Microbacterium testaceum]GEB46918.1 serine/threonine protein phosphatase [Microbacterium testaceum]